MAASGGRGRSAAWSLLAALLVCGGVAGAAAGQTPAPPIKVKPAQLVAGSEPLTVVVTNETATPLTVTPTLVGAPGTAEAKSPTVPGGGLVAVTVRLTGAATADAQLVLAVGPSAAFPAGWVTRVPISPPVEKSPAVPAVDKWRATSYGGVPLWLPVLRSVLIPLKAAGTTCAAVALPSGDHVGAAPPDPKTTSTVVGTLHGEGRSVTVSAQCRMKDGAPVARLSFSPVDKQGIDYTGNIDLVPDEADKVGTVALTLRRTTQPVDFLALLAVGLGLALVATGWTTTGRTANAALRDVERLRWSIDPTNANGAITQFKQIIEAAGVTGPVPRWDLRSALAESLTSIRTMILGGRRFGGDADVMKKAQSRLGTLEGTIDGLPHLGNRLARLDSVRGRFEALEAFRADVTLATLARPGPVIAVDELPEIDAKAKLGIEVAGWWPVERIATALASYQALVAIPGGSAAFNRARGEARAAWNLYDERRRGAVAVEELKGALGQFELASAATATALQMRPVEEARAAFDDVPGALAGAASPDVAYVDAAVTDPLGTSRLLRLKGMVADGALMVALLLVALMAGTKALYLDKAVGGWWDYAEAVGWGLASTTVVQPLAAGIRRVAEGWRPDAGGQAT